jgi:Leucine-rich repeat (LRR) protein
MDQDGGKRDSPRPRLRRRWLQFSLRSLLILVLFCAVASAWFTHRFKQKRAEREAAEALAKAGGWISYDYQLGPVNAPDPGPEWLQKLVGENLFNNVTNVAFMGQDGDGRMLGSGGSVTDEELHNLLPLSNLTSLSLAGTPRITDVGMDDIKRLTQLEYLAILGTQVGDAGLTDIKGLTRLKRLYLERNKVSDAGLATIRNLTDLIELDLQEEGVTDAGLINIEPLKRLQKLTLKGPKFTDAGLEHIRELRDLRTLSVRSDSISDSGLKNFRGLIHLASLSLIYTNMTDAGIENFEGMNMLMWLDLTGSDITDAGLRHLKRFSRLATLTLNATQVTDAGVVDFQTSFPKCQISYWHSDRASKPR